MSHARRCLVCSQDDLDDDAAKSQTSQTLSPQKGKLTKEEMEDLRINKAAVKKAAGGDKAMAKAIDSVLDDDAEDAEAFERAKVARTVWQTPLSSELKVPVGIHTSPIKSLLTICVGLPTSC